MLLLMPPVQAGDQVVLQIEPSFGQLASNIISILTAIGLLLYLLSPQLMRHINFHIARSVRHIKFKWKLSVKVPVKISEKVKKSNIFSQDEEDY
jgi:hypothetical protein